MRQKSLTGLLLAGLLVSASTAHGEPEPGTTFSDIAGHWAQASIEWGVMNGIVHGHADGSFQPDRTVTEAEFTAMLLRSYGIPGEGGSGAETDWTAPYYEAARLYHMPLQGLAAAFRREQPILREQVAEVVAGIDGRRYTGPDAVRYMLQKGYARGKLRPELSPGLTVYGYRGEDPLTRAEALTLIQGLHGKGLAAVRDRPAEPSPAENLPALSGERLSGYHTDRGQSGPVLYYTYDVERGTVYFTDNQANRSDPGRRIQLKETYNPRINQQLYGIANSLYDPDREPLGLMYSKKGHPEVEVVFGTGRQPPQEGPPPYNAPPFQYVLSEAPGNSPSSPIELRLRRLWGNGEAEPRIDDYYAGKLRSSLVSFLGEKDGIRLSGVLVEELAALMKDQARVKDWRLLQGSPESEYGRSLDVELERYRAAVHVSIHDIQVNFLTDDLLNPKASHFAALPDGRTAVDGEGPVPYKDLAIQVRSAEWRPGSAYVSAGRTTLREEEISTPYGPAVMAEHEIYAIDDPDRKRLMQFEIRLPVDRPGEPGVKDVYLLSGTVTGQDAAAAKQQLLGLLPGWVVPLK